MATVQIAETGNPSICLQRKLMSLRTPVAWGYHIHGLGVQPRSMTWFNSISSCIMVYIWVTQCAVMKWNIRLAKSLEPGGTYSKELYQVWGCMVLVGKSSSLYGKSERFWIGAVRLSSTRTSCLLSLIETLSLPHSSEILLFRMRWRTSRSRWA